MGTPCRANSSALAATRALRVSQHFGSGAEEAVGRHQAANALMRPLEIVMVDEQTNPPLGIAQVEEDRALEALAPQRPPEALDLAQRLRMARRGHDLLMPRFSSSFVKALLPRQVTY